MNQKKTFRYQRFYFLNALFLILISVSYTNANVHYVCNDSSFFINEAKLDAKRNHIKNDHGILNNKDSIFIVQGTNLTFIPDSTNNDFSWEVYDYHICEHTTYETDTLQSSSEGRYYYGSWNGTYKFICYVFIVDSSSIQFELKRILSEENRYKLVIKPFFNEYLWSTGDTTNTTEISESGLYWIETIDHCGNAYSKEILINITPGVLAGEIDTTSMIFDSLGFVIPCQSYYTGEFALDSDKDGTTDLLFEIDIDNANGYYKYEYLVTPSNGYQICVNPELFVKNIQAGDAVNNKLRWTEDSQLIISYRYFGILNVGMCYLGWSLSWQNTTVKHIGFRKVLNDNYLYGWLSLSYFDNDGYITFREYAMQANQTDIQEHTIREIEIRPNPFNEFIIIEGEFKEGILEIFTADGKQVFNGEIETSNQKFDLHFLRPGLYIGSIQTKDNNYTFKVIKTAK